MVAMYRIVTYGQLVDGQFRQSNQLTHSPVALGGIVGNTLAGFLHAEASAVHTGSDLVDVLGGSCSSGIGSWALFLHWSATHSHTPIL